MLYGFLGYTKKPAQLLLLLWNWPLSTDCQIETWNKFGVSAKGRFIAAGQGDHNRAGALKTVCHTGAVRGHAKAVAWSA